MDWIGITALVISLVALGVGGWQMYMSRSRYKDLKKDHDDLKENDRLILGYLHRKLGLQLKGSTTFAEPEMTVSAGKRRAKKPIFPLTLRRLLGKLLP